MQDDKGWSMRDISIKGAKTHNLKNIDVTLPREKLLVVSGVSGSGKSSLAFDTIFAEGQRRFLECLSSSARSLLENLPKAHVDEVSGLPPTIALKQRSTGLSSRSTVGTVTEIDHYLRLLYSRIGVPYCPSDDEPLSRSTVSEIVESTITLSMGQAVFIKAPYTGGYEYTHMREYFEEMIATGYSRFEADGVVHVFDEAPRSVEFNYDEVRRLFVVVDRVVVKPDSRERLSASVQTALLLGGRVFIKERDTSMEYSYTSEYGCPKCGFSIGRLDVGMFSPRTKKGRCEACGGSGVSREWDIEKILAFPSLSVSQGAIVGWSSPGQEAYQRLSSYAQSAGFSLDEPFESYSKSIQDAVIHGCPEFSGVLNDLDDIYSAAPEAVKRIMSAKLMKKAACRACGGSGVSEAARIVKIGSGASRKSLHELEALTLENAAEYLKSLEVDSRSKGVFDEVVPAVISRLECLVMLGIGYLSLDRSGDTLSGGETQRIQLASHVGGTMSGVMYVLDEPSIGLHPQDTNNMIEALKRLRDNGNTVLVVEHDLSIIRSADYVYEVGPGAGERGGELVAEGSPEEIARNPNSLTGAYLSGRRTIKHNEVPTFDPDQAEWMVLEGASGRNLKDVDLKIPLGRMTVVTGSSGSGKTTLVMQTLLPILANRYNHAEMEGLDYKSFSFNKSIQKVVNVDQSPIGRTPRSNPATYTRLFDGIRGIFANTQMSRERGYSSKRFSFNVKGGRCEICEGAGVQKVSMQFLPDVYVECEACMGRRYNRETLEVKYKGLSISDVLNLTVDEAVPYFEGHPQLQSILSVMQKVGLGYIKLGQSCMELSGGEAQRVKLATELARSEGGGSVYLLDEPTTGLHASDIEKLLGALRELSAKGNTIILIEHNTDVIKASDWVVDMGPKGGAGGGRIVAEGFWKDLVDDPNSVTGPHLRS